jgi:hypothetical protein
MRTTGLRLRARHRPTCRADAAKQTKTGSERLQPPEARERRTF